MTKQEILFAENGGINAFVPMHKIMQKESFIIQVPFLAPNHVPDFIVRHIFIVQTTTDCVGGAEKALAMGRKEKLLLV